MGVVHKLKKEVFDFIVKKKRDDPSISCRKLSVLTSDTFKIKVSKSSVNSVLKDTQLSSAVGRRVQKKAKSKKFQIPPQKKKQLLDSISSLGFTINEKVSADREVIDKEANQSKKADIEETGFSLEKLSQDLQEHDRKKRRIKSLSNGKTTCLQDSGIVEGNVKGAFLNKSEFLADADAELLKQERKEYIVPVGPKFFDEEQFLYEVKIAREDKEKRRKHRNLYDNAGVVFLKAAQIDMSSENLLGDLFGKNSHGMTLKDFNNICSSLIFLKAFDVQSVETIEGSKNDALWVLNGFRGYPGRENFFGWTQKIAFSNQLQFEYLNEKEQALKSVSAFKVIFEDSTSITLDAQMSSLWREEVRKELFSSVSSAMKTLSRRLISNNDCLAMDVLSKKGTNSSDLERLMVAFCNISKRKMQKIEVLSEKQEIIADFTLIPSIQRSLVVGFRASHELFKVLSQYFSDILEFSYYDNQRDSILYYFEKIVPFSEVFINVHESAKSLSGQKSLKLVFLGKSKNKGPQIVLLTNMIAETAEIIIGRYLKRWPRALNQYHIKEEMIRSINSEEPLVRQQEYCAVYFLERRFENLGDIFNDHLLTLNEYCLDKYFPKQKVAVDIKTMVPIFYGLKGFVQESLDQLIVSLVVPDRYDFLDVLEFAINRVNSRQLITREGKGLFLNAEHVKV